MKGSHTLTFFASRRLSHVLRNWIFLSIVSPVYRTNERYLSVPCPTFEPGELTPSHRYQQSGISCSANTKYVVCGTAPFFRANTPSRSTILQPKPRKKMGPLPHRKVGVENHPKSLQIPNGRLLLDFSEGAQRVSTRRRHRLCAAVCSLVPMGRVREKQTSLHTAGTAMPPFFCAAKSNCKETMTSMHTIFKKW